MAETSSASLIATGMLPFVVLASALLTAPLAIALLALYRRAVLRSMAASGAGAAAAPAADVPPPPPPATALRIDPAPPAAGPTAAETRAATALRRAAGVQLAGGLAYAAVFTAAWMAILADSGLPPLRLLWLFACHVWPAVLALGLAATAARRPRLLLALAYLAVLAAVALAAMARNPDFSAGQAVFFWLYLNAPPTLLLLAFLRRRVRAVGPLVLAFVIVAVTGAQVAVSLAGRSEATLRAAVDAGGLLGLGGTGTFYALMALGAALAAGAGWKWLQWLGRRYRQRRTGDQMLTLDAMWLLFGVVQSIGLAFEGLAWLGTGLAAIAARKAVVLAGNRLAGLDRVRSPAPSLLLLRVFALGARSERLFDALALHWLRAGDISLIAGPDLATTTVEPHEFLDFVGGRLSRQFVQGDADLAQRLQARALGPDPDGRHRVNEFFCHADTWQPAMRRLAAGADAVLMDLRGFSPASQGCRYELQQLLDAVPLARIVCLVDATTDRAFLDTTLRQLWQTVAADSPNRRLPEARLRLHVADAHSDTAVAPLLRLLHAAAEGR